MADGPEAPDVPITHGNLSVDRGLTNDSWWPANDRDEFGEITTKTRDLRPYNQAKERRLEMQRLLQFFSPVNNLWPFCPVCGNRHFEWLKR